MTESSPQLLEKVFKPFSGLALVPSGKITKEPPSLIFSEPSFKTFFRLENLFDLFIDIGLRHAKAHPNIGIYKSSFFKML